MSIAKFLITFARRRPAGRQVMSARLLVNVVIPDRVKEHNLLISAKLKDNAVFVTDGKRKKVLQRSFEFVRPELQVEGILPKQLFVLFRDLLNW